jgi:hypothetical protein
MLWSIATDLSFESTLSVERRMQMLGEMLCSGEVRGGVVTCVAVRQGVRMEDISLQKSESRDSEIVVSERDNVLSGEGGDALNSLQDEIFDGFVWISSFEEWLNRTILHLFQPDLFPAKMTKLLHR